MSATALPGEQAVSAARISPIRRVCSFPAALGCLLVVLSVLTVKSRFDDPDMWWHLKTGQIISTTHTIPTTDIFSYTTHHHAYIPHEWLAQLLIYGAYRLGGYSGLMLCFCFFTAALLIAGYVLCSLYAGNPKIGFLGALTLWLFATAGLSIRPQMIGYLLLVIELLIFHLGRTRDRRWFFGLPPLFAFWVNCHGSFFLGLLVAGIFFATSFSSFQTGSLISIRWTSTVRKTLLLSLALSIPALFCNPIGITQVLYPVNTLLHQPLGLSQVEEWQPLQLSNGRGLGLLAVLACITLVVIVRHSELLWHELLLLALGTWLAVSHQRLVFVFGILAAPVLSRLLSTFWDGYRQEKDRPLPNAILIVASLLIAFWAFPGQATLAQQVEQASPVKAVEFIKTNHLSGRMLNEYVYGGYLIWAAPENPVFIDGRADVFEWTGVLADFGRWETLQSNPNVLLEKYGIDFCLLARSSPMVTVMSLLKDWKIAYEDNNSVIFTHAVTQ